MAMHFSRMKGRSWRDKQDKKDHSVTTRLVVIWFEER
jgi:hypothetical protein